MMKCACPCGIEFEPQRPNQIYRSPECRARAKRERSLVFRVNRLERARVKYRRMRPGADLRRGNPGKPQLEASQGNLTQSEPLLKTSQVAELLGVSQWLVRWWRCRGVDFGPDYIRLGPRAVRYLPSDVRAFVCQRRVLGRREPNQAGKEVINGVF